MRQEIQKVLDSPDWSDAEKTIVKWQFNLYGSFYTALFEAIQRADPINLKRLELGFPDEVKGFRLWNDESNELANKIDEAIGL